MTAAVYEGIFGGNFRVRHRVSWRRRIIAARSAPQRHQDELLLPEAYPLNTMKYKEDTKNTIGSAEQEAIASYSSSSSIVICCQTTSKKNLI